MTTERPLPSISDAEEKRIQAGIARDPDNPELTDDQLLRMKPGREVLPADFVAALEKHAPDLPRDILGAVGILPDGGTLTVTKEEAAMRHVDVAIDAFLAGNLDIVITLAGAAEGMLADRKGSDLWSFMMKHPDAEAFDRKELVAVVNAERDWLKHPTPDAPDRLTLSAIEPAIFLMRAMTKLATWTPKMEAMKPVLNQILTGESLPKEFGQK